MELDDEALSSVYINVNVIMQELVLYGCGTGIKSFRLRLCSCDQCSGSPVNTVKLERMFVWQLENNPASACIGRTDPDCQRS